MLRRISHNRIGCRRHRHRRQRECRLPSGHHIFASLKLQPKATDIILFSIAEYIWMNLLFVLHVLLHTRTNRRIHIRQNSAVVSLLAMEHAIVVLLPWHRRPSAKEIFGKCRKKCMSKWMSSVVGRLFHFAVQKIFALKISYSTNSSNWTLDKIWRKTFIIAFCQPKKTEKKASAVDVETSFLSLCQHIMGHTVTAIFTLSSSSLHSKTGNNDRSEWFSFADIWLSRRP